MSDRQDLDLLERLKYPSRLKSTVSLFFTSSCGIGSAGVGVALTSLDRGEDGNLLGDFLEAHGSGS